MNAVIVSLALSASVLLTGCGKKSTPAATEAPASPATPATPSAAPMAQSLITSWQQGDHSTAVSNFLRMDWKSGPLFAADSTLSISEEQFKALSAENRQVKSTKMLEEVTAMKHLGAAVAYAGREAATRGDDTEARRVFDSLKQFGDALDQTNRLALLRLVGQGLKKRADTELSQLPK